MLNCKNRILAFLLILTAFSFLNMMKKREVKATARKAILQNKQFSWIYHTEETDVKKKPQTKKKPP